VSPVQHGVEARNIMLSVSTGQSCISEYLKMEISNWLLTGWRPVTDRSSIQGLSGGIKAIKRPFCIVFERTACWPMCICAVNLVCTDEQHVWDVCSFTIILSDYIPPHDPETRNVTNIGVRSLLLGLVSYLFPFRYTRLSTYWGSRRERL